MEFIRDHNFSISGVDLTGTDSVVELPPGFKTKRIELKLTDPATGLEVIKAITFKEGRYDVDLEVKVTRAGQPCPRLHWWWDPVSATKGSRNTVFTRWRRKGSA